MRYIILFTCIISFASCNADHQTKKQKIEVTEELSAVSEAKTEVVEAKVDQVSSEAVDAIKVEVVEDQVVVEKVVQVTNESKKDVVDKAVTKEEINKYTEVADPPRPEPEILTAIEVEELVEEEADEAAIDLYGYWDDATKRLVTSDGKVNYISWKKEEAKLDDFLAELGGMPVKDLGRNAQLAYWINLYNAATVKLILKNYPLKSITNLDKPWDQKWIKAGDKTLSLNDIEHEIIRPQFKDPRIHAAVNCAAVSCPKLLNEAFRAETVNAQLDQNMQDWLFKSGKNKLGENSIELSKIFEWYGVDFGDLVPYINKVAGKKYASDTPVTFIEYNWSLNKL